MENVLRLLYFTMIMFTIKWLQQWKVCYLRWPLPHLLSGSLWSPWRWSRAQWGRPRRGPACRRAERGWSWTSWPVLGGSPWWSLWKPYSSAAECGSGGDRYRPGGTPGTPWAPGDEEGDGTEERMMGERERKWMNWQRKVRSVLIQRC